VSAAPVGTDKVSLGQVEQFFYDSLCTCIDNSNPQETRECFRSDDCCPARPVCFPDPDTGKSSCITCRASAQSCNNDGDCCSPQHCFTSSPGNKFCSGPGGCFAFCTRNEDCDVAHGVTCGINECIGSVCNPG
jgi:hypothetical protein